MDTLLSKASTLDALLVLSGEHESNPTRSNLAAYLFHRVARNSRRVIPIVVTGSHSGFTEPPETKHWEIVYNNLLSLGVPQQIISLEKEALDTFANFVYSKPLLDKMDAKRIGLVTDRFHMRRSMWTGRRVLGTEYNLVALPTKKDTDLIGKLTEIAVLTALQFDLSGKGITDDEKIKSYLTTKHPFHSTNPEFSFYKMGVLIKRNIGF